MTRFVFKAITSAIVVTAALGAIDAAAQTKYTAEVRRTSFGIPHVKAGDFGGIGYGVGYAFAQDNICVMADTFVSVRGERSRYFGGSGTDALGVNNLANDFFYAFFNGDAAALSAGLARMKPEVQAAFKGWAAGYNRYLRDTGVANLPAPCKGAAWVKSVDEVDMMRLVRSLAIRASSAGNGSFIGAFAITNPPAAAAATVKSAEELDGLAGPDVDVPLALDGGATGLRHGVHEKPYEVALGEHHGGVTGLRVEVLRPQGNGLDGFVGHAQALHRLSVEPPLSCGQGGLPV